MEKTPSQETASLDGALVVRLSRAYYLMLLLLSVFVFATSSDGAFERTLERYRETAPLLLGGFVVALAISKDMRNDVVALFRRTPVAEALGSKRARGYVRVVEPVRHARTGALVGAYFFAVPSPRERWWTDLVHFLLRRSTMHGHPADAISSRMGKLEIELDSGEVARIDTDAFEPAGFWRSKGLTPLDLVIRDGDRVQIEGDCAWDRDAALPTLAFTSQRKRLRIRVLRG